MRYTQNKIVTLIAKGFDNAEKKWHSPNFVKIMASTLIFTYLTTILFIELKKTGVIGWHLIPANHFKAIEMAFTLLLFFEVISLVFALAHSVSKSMEIQLQIMSLILLRNAFKIFGSFPNDYQIMHMQKQIMNMFADAFGALIIFGIILIIRKYDKHRALNRKVDLQKSFILAKKFIGFIMLIVFIIMIASDVSFFFMEQNTFNFFKAFFTFMIFIDILLVFISLRYSIEYQILFRNSGFALATIIMRLAFEAYAPYNNLMGIGAALFVLSLVIIYNRIPLQTTVEK